MAEKKPASPEPTLKPTDDFKEFSGWAGVKNDAKQPTAGTTPKKK